MSDRSDVQAGDRSTERILLLTGATGFVGEAVRPALVAAGWRVRCLTRNATSARAREQDLEWVEGDVGDPESMDRALAGCEAALYLVHGIGEGRDYHQREVAAAACFARAAASAGVRRIVYLGGVAPSSAGSEHLRSRIEVGETLRAGPVQTIELRASMIIGRGSLSWLIVRDLAARLPVMVLPRWLRSRTQPVGIDDVVIALVRTLDLPSTTTTWFDLPGPQTMSGREILEQTARAMGLPRPRMVTLPLLSPRLSSQWVRFVTRARWSVAREVVVGLTEDLLARSDELWQLIDHPRRQPFAEAASRALEASPPPGVWGAVERMRHDLAAQRGRDQLVARSWRYLAPACVVAWVIAASGTRWFGIWAALGGVAIGLGVVVLVVDRQTRATLRPGLTALAVGALGGGLMVGATYVLYPWVIHVAPVVGDETERLYDLFRAPPQLLASLALVVVVVGEELVWRGAVQHALVRRFGPWSGVAIAAILYSLAHAPVGSPMLVVAALLCGLMWGALRLVSGSLVPTLVAHLVWDFLVLMWLPLDSLARS